MNAAKDCTLQEKLLRCAMALILAAGALLASVATSPAYAAPSTVDVSIGGKIPYGGFATTWMSADGNIAYCAEPSSPTPAPGSYSTSPVPSGDVTAAIWYSFGSPGFDASMFPGSWYDGGGWDDAKYAAASHVLIAYAYSGSESAATHGTSSEFASWAKSELIGGTFAKMKAGAGRVSAGFEAFCVRTGGGSQTLVSFSWSTGGVKVAKTDSEAGAEPQGDASLDGASFSVVNETGRYVLVGGKYYADGEVCATIKTAPEDGSHVAATGADALPAGNYRIVESGAPEGYDASDASVAFTVKAGEVRDLTGDPVTDEVFRGGVQVTKSDKELQASEALAGSGHKEAPGEHPGLDGIEFTVTNRSAHKVLVDGEWREPGEAVATLTTAWNDEAGAYTAQTAANALPYGTYDVRETATNGSYLLTDGEPRTFEVRAGGEIVSASADGAALEFRDQVVRNDLELSKKSESDNAGLMVPFAIENAATGETHVLVTDRNGDASTASSWNRHSRDTNANDALLGHEDPIAVADMDPKAGIWFSLGEDDSSAPVDDSLAALPYGAYTMTELRCEANEGLELITRSFWIDRDSTVAKAVWMGLDDQEGPRISTTAKDGADGDKDVSADAEAKVVDAVAYEGLKAGEEYELSATLVDKATGEPVADASGMPVEAKAEFAPALSTGSQDVEISFDASLLGGRDLVVFESLRKDGAEVASHADLSDEGQTVHVAVEVGTQAANAADGDQVIEAGKAKVVDTVAYKGLVPGKTYIAVGTLMDKGTGEPFLDKDGNEVTARALRARGALRHRRGDLRVRHRGPGRGRRARRLREGPGLRRQRRCDPRGHRLRRAERRRGQPRHARGPRGALRQDRGRRPRRHRLRRGRGHRSGSCGGCGRSARVPQAQDGRRKQGRGSRRACRRAGRVAAPHRYRTGGPGRSPGASPANGGGHEQRESCHGARHCRGVAGDGGARRPAAAREEPVRGARGAYCGRGRDNGGSRDGRRHRLGRPSRLRRRLGARAGHDRRLPDRPGPA